MPPIESCREVFAHKLPLFIEVNAPCLENHCKRAYHEADDKGEAQDDELECTHEQSKFIQNQYTSTNTYASVGNGEYDSSKKGIQVLLQAIKVLGKKHFLESLPLDQELWISTTVGQS